MRYGSLRMKSEGRRDEMGVLKPRGKVSGEEEMRRESAAAVKALVVLPV